MLSIPILLFPSHDRRMTPEERERFLEEKRRASESDPDGILINREGFRGESFINQLDRNKSMGIDNIY